MSSVGEMHCLVHEAADYTAPTRNWKDRVHAAARAFDLGWERARAFYYRDARRVDAEEMDRARRAIRRLREQARERKNAEHLAWLNSTLAHLRASDPDFHREQIDGLEQVLSRVGALDSAVGSTEPADVDD
jgi:hypothetical protein